MVPPHAFGPGSHVRDRCDSGGPGKHFAPDGSLNSLELTNPRRLLRTHLQTRLDGDPPCGRHALERFVVTFVLIGVGIGKLRKSPVE